MRAAVLDKFGDEDVMIVRDEPVPKPAAGQILVRVRAAAINPIDWKMREGMMAARYGADFPMVLGWDCSGEVTEVGSGVTEFAVGDEVYARSDVGCGGCYAEFAVLNVGTVVRKPIDLSHIEAASFPLAALTAVNGLRDCARLGNGQRVLIVGASGGVGTLAVQIARNMGAGHVAAVCSGRNAELVASLGADDVIDYTQADALAADVPYDIIYDTVGVHDHESARAALTPEGTYLTLVPVAGIDFFIPGQSSWEPGKGYFVAWVPTAADLQLVSDWVSQGQLRPVIDSVFPLEQIQQAHLRSQTERAVGKIVLDISVSSLRQLL